MQISRRHVTLGIVVSAALLVTGIAVLKWREGNTFSETRALLSRFPAEDAIVLNIDLASVRKAGLLSASKIPLEPEYKKFLDGTAFDYRRDLDSVTASFSKSGNFFIARGRFNWSKLRDYATHQGGSCYQELCRMPGSTPERRISFLPLRDDTLALAVSTDDLAANRLTKEGDPVSAPIPSSPVWMSVPGTALRQAGGLPSGLRLMLSAMTNADRLTITVDTANNGLAAKLDAACRTPDDARILASQLRTVTATLKEALQTDKDAQADVLAQTLAAGAFDDSGAHVNGRWPFNKSLISSLTDGI